MDSQYCVIVFEPALPGEELSVEQQVHEVAGPFESEAVADEWTRNRQADNALSAEFAHAPSHFTFLITKLSANRSIFVT